MGAVAQSPWKGPYPKLSDSFILQVSCPYSDMGSIRDYPGIPEIHPEASK